jgi:hypothetical protein
MRGKDLIFRGALASAAILAWGCDTIPGEPEHVIGIWGGPHAGLEVQGGLADVQFDCASGTIDDPLYPAADGTFAVKGTYRTGAPGPIKVGEYFRSQGAVYSGQVTKAAAKTAPRSMTFRVALEDGTILGPFTVKQGQPPQLTRCA